MRKLLYSEVLPHPVFDVLLKALMRAEIRFISRYVPQRSHEERLTGSLVAEIDAAIYAVRPVMRNLTKQIYKAEKDVDFLYYDLSRGGKIEQKTGADLALTLVVDLPDHPRILETVILQVKKYDRSAQLDIEQYRTLTTKWGKEAHYLFYDMSFARLTSPLIYGAGLFGERIKEAEANRQSLSSVTCKDIVEKGIPVSLYIAHDMGYLCKGRQRYATHAQLRDAVKEHIENVRSVTHINGRFAIMSIGQPLSLSVTNDGLQIDL
jgi:hypothetical protein